MLCLHANVFAQRLVKDKIQHPPPNPHKDLEFGSHYRRSHLDVNELSKAREMDDYCSCKTVSVLYMITFEFYIISSHLAHPFQGPLILLLFFSTTKFQLQPFPGGFWLLLDLSASFDAMDRAILLRCLAAEPGFGGVVWVVQITPYKSDSSHSRCKSVIANVGVCSK